MDWDSFVGPAVVAACIAGAVYLLGRQRTTRLLA